MTVYDGLSPVQGIAPAWSEIPTALLRAELARRRESADNPPSCGSRGPRASYNTPLHVTALVIILVLSTLACSFPITVRRFPSLPIPHTFLFLSRHFGTGVLIATAFVHLLPTAYTSLTDPCLPSFWNDGYPAMAGLIAMISVLVVVGIEMFFATRGAGHIHGSEYDALPLNGNAQQGMIGRPALHKRSSSFHRLGDRRSGSHSGPPHIMLADYNEHGSSENLMDGRSPSVPAHSPLPRVRRASTSSASSDLSLSDLDPLAATSGAVGAPAPSLDPAARQKQLLQCLLLEAGILFHSIFIGMALSVAVGTSFVVLLVAISFHQTFEGLALGSRISAIHFPARSPQPWLMALAYGTTTPLGQAIGLLVHGLYDPASQTGLLMVGVTNAISSGLLLFAGLVELLAEDFLSDESYQTLQGRRRLQACGAVVGGAALMAIVGAWA